MHNIISILDELVDEVGEDDEHPLASLMETLGSLIEAYEDEYVPELLGNPLSTLRILMAEHGLKNNDLSEIGDESTVAAILNGDCELTQTQLYSLGKRFHVSPAVFL